MLQVKSSLEKEIETEIALLERELELIDLSDAPAAPVYHLEDKNIIRADFNRNAGTAAPVNRARRASILRRLDYLRLRYSALYIHRSYAAGFALAA